MADMPAYKRAEILLRTASLLCERSEDLAKTIAAEAGKALKFCTRRSGSHRTSARYTISHPKKPSVCTENLSAGMLFLQDKIFWIYGFRPSRGVIAAISPFTFH